jgi:hypothetical protein
MVAAWHAVCVPYLLNYHDCQSAMIKSVTILCYSNSGKIGINLEGGFSNLKKFSPSNSRELPREVWHLALRTAVVV